MPSNTKQHLFEIARYGMKGGVTLIINVLVMMILVELAGIRPEFAAIISTSLVIVLGYVLMNRFVFPNAPRPGSRPGVVKRAGLYYVTIMTGKTTNYLLFLGLLYLGVWYPAAWLLGAAVVFVGLYSANRYLWHGSVTA